MIKDYCHLDFVMLWNFKDGFPTLTNCAVKNQLLHNIEGYHWLVEVFIRFVWENSRAHTIAFALIIDWFSNQFRILELCYSNLPSKIGNLIQLQFLSTQDSDRAMTQGDGKSLEDSPRQASFVNAGSGSELGSGLGVQPEIWWN